MQLPFQRSGISLDLVFLSCNRMLVKGLFPEKTLVKIYNNPVSNQTFCLANKSWKNVTLVVGWKESTNET